MVVCLLFTYIFSADKDDLEVLEDKANAWTMEHNDVEKQPNGKEQKNLVPSSGKLDSKRLEYFSDVESLHSLLKHPLLVTFLELELASLRIRYFFDFLLFLLFVICLFLHLGNKYGVFTATLSGEGEGVVFTLENVGPITYYIFILFILTIILILKEFYQIIQQRKKYFFSLENYVEWFVIASAIFNIIPKQYFSKELDSEAQRHLAALTLLISFMQVYLLGVRVAPNTALPLYINMFVTVLKSYTFILMYFLAFIVSFAYTFFLIFGYNRDLLLAKTSNSTSGSTLV